MNNHIAPLHKNATDLTGKVFGRLTVLYYDGKKGRRLMWKCACNCGNIISAISDNLVRGNTNSCGCFHKSQTRMSNSTHGMSKTPIYMIWRAMINRCTNTADINWHNYGGRGIMVCSEWLKSFECFYADMGDRPAGHSIDRTDNAKDYSKENCKWVPHRVNCWNKRTNRMLTYNGESHCISEWESILGCSNGTIRQRLHRGWSIKRALTHGFAT